MRGEGSDMPLENLMKRDFKAVAAVALLDLAAICVSACAPPVPS
jgi:hypothetical protein